jgi:hypothetical protein
MVGHTFTLHLHTNINLHYRTGRHRPIQYHNKCSITGDGTFDTSRTKLLAQLILDGKYTSKNETYEQSPVDKLTLSKNKGRYNLFTTREQANQLANYTEHLLAILPQWLKCTAHNKGKHIAVSTKPALHQGKKNRDQTNTHHRYHHKPSKKNISMGI